MAKFRLSRNTNLRRQITRICTEYLYTNFAAEKSEGRLGNPRDGDLGSSLNTSSEIFCSIQNLSTFKIHPLLQAV